MRKKRYFVRRCSVWSEAVFVHCLMGVSIVEMFWDVLGCFVHCLMGLSIVGMFVAPEREES